VSNNRLSAPLSARSLLPNSFNPASSVLFRKKWTLTQSGRARDKRDFDILSDALPFGRLWYREPKAISHAIEYAKHYSRAHDAVISVYDAVGNVIETHEQAGDFKEW
jgi:hypothetical protein